MGLIIGGGNTKSGGGGGDVRLETNHSATIETNGTHVVTPQEGYDGMRKATIKVDVQSEGTAADKALAQATTLDGRLYNLWEVLPQVKADPRVSNYAVIMLAEYFQGYNSLVLQGANAFLTCDGAFYTTANTTQTIQHFWHDNNGMMMNRWVAFLYTNEHTPYTPASADRMPRSIIVDGKMGYIDLSTLVVRCKDFYTTENSSIDGIYHNGSSTASAWLAFNSTYIGNVLFIDSSVKAEQFSAQINSGNIVANIKKTNTVIFNRLGNNVVNVELPTLVESSLHIFNSYSNCAQELTRFSADELVLAENVFRTYSNFPVVQLQKLRYISLKALTRITGSFYVLSSVSAPSNALPNVIHIEIGQGFLSDLDMRVLSFANCLLTNTKSLVEDVAAHPTWSNLDQWLYNFEHLIVDKLADLSGQTAKTITLAATPYAAITSEIRAKMSAKNWNLASA